MKLPDYNHTYAFCRGVIFVLLEHLPIFMVIALYYGYSIFIEHLLNYKYKLTINIDILNMFSWFTLLTLCFFFIAHFAVRVINDDIPGLAPKWHDIANNYLTIRNIGGFILIYTLFPIVAHIFSFLKGMIPFLWPYDWDVTFMEWDYILHLHQHPWLLFNGILQNHILLKFFDLSYASWYFFVHVITFWLAWSRRRILRLQFFVCNLFILFIIGNCLATVFSSAGPCYYTNVAQVEGDNPYAPLMKRLHDFNEQNPLVALTLQKKLLDDYNQQGRGDFLAISAMPSVHVAYVTMFALTFASLSFTLGLIFWIYWAIIQLGSVILGWHYAIDGYFATLLTIALWKFSALFNYWVSLALPEKIRNELFPPNLDSLKGA
jgi:hypothetical protein